ncbi:ABC transporter ATP-binding protein [Cupriavidus metallidurans]|uniref:ABC transporter ATP-binding protein n=1 Tax=Cupriavidus metallidurans TaxID=119219 RepID=UPI001CCD1063|nr:ABC transporter ATP-binding protein [Cupriavidus metallidurans]UBM07665.1 ABC transporter ATP-binding protein [Cupriavidus metallidurans]
MGELIQFQHVSQFFAVRDSTPTQALNEVSLDVRAGEFVCLIGPSGCGKTTLMHLLAGFVKPTAGAVRFRGEPVRGPGPERGVVFQEYALFPWMTASQNVEFGLRALKVDAGERKRRALQALERVHLSHAADRYPNELSGGMRQRIAVARSLVVEPQVLLMDEPFAAVDAMTRASLQNDLLRLWQEIGVSVLFVTHNIDEAIFLAQRVVVMAAHPGSVRADIAIELPYPRQRGSLEFAQHYAEIESALAEGYERRAG